MPYLGQRPSKGDENNFKILDDISSYTLTFDGSDSSVVSAANDTITSLTHRFVQGQRVTYNKGGGTVITGLSDGVYYIIKEDHNTIKLATSASNASNGVAVNITGVGAGSSHTLNVAFDGINTKFKATHTNGQKARITRSAQLVISINGVIQQPHDTATPSTGFGFDLDGTIVFSQAPVSTDEYWAHVLTNNNVTFDISNNDIDNFTGDGSTTEFNLSKTPPDNRNILVTIDGVVQYPNDPDGTARAYVVVENVLTFNTAPDSGVEIQVRHIGFAGSTSDGSGVTNFYGRTGSVVLKNTDNITVNDAAITGDATVTGNLTINGDFTTLNTTLREVELLRVDANNDNVAAGIITQTGTGDILNLFDGSSEVFSVADGGATYISNALTINRTTGLAGSRISINNVASFPAIGVQLNQLSGITTSLTAFNSAGQQIFDLAHDTDSTPDLIFKLKHTDTGAPTEKLRIKSDGNVGLGTTNPSALLHLHGSSPQLYFTDTNTNVESQIDNDSSAGNFAINVDVNNSAGSNSNFLIRFNNTHPIDAAKFLINQTGKVGIGTSNPSQLLHLAADSAHKILLKRSGAAPSEVIFGNEGNYAVISNNTNGIDLQTGSTPSSSMHIDQNGDVGIGTDDPQERLHVHQDTGTTTVLISSPTAPQIRINPNATDGSDNDRTIFGQATANNHFVSTAVADDTVLRGTSTGNLIFGIATSEKLRITSSGQVSISGAGTTFGNNTLLNIAPANRTTAFDASDGDTWHDVVIKQGASATTNSVGIAFEVSPSAYHKNAGTGIVAIKDGNNFDYGTHLAFVTRPHTAVAEERVRITSAGSVNIGGDYSQTTTKFHVEGKASITDTGGDVLKLQSTVNTSRTTLKFVTNGNDWEIGSRGSAGEPNNAFYIYDNAANEYRTVINPSGKVGIGTDNPTAHLQVYRKTAFASNPIIQARSNNGSTNELKFQIDGDGDAYFNGDVGIGTDNPSTEFHVHDGNSVLVSLFESKTHDSRVRIKAPDNKLSQLEFADDDADAGEIRYNHATDEMTFHVRANNEKLGITSTGQVKITGSDDQDNFIVDAAQTQFKIHQDSTDGEISLRAEDGSGNNYAKYMTFFVEGGSGSTERLRIAANGSIGAGTTANIDERVHFEHDANITMLVETTATGSGANAALRLKSAESSSDWYVQTGHAAGGGLRFYGGNEKVRITTKGTTVSGGTIPSDTTTYSSSFRGREGVISPIYYWPRVYGVHDKGGGYTDVAEGNRLELRMYGALGGTKSMFQNGFDADSYGAGGEALDYNRVRVLFRVSRANTTDGYNANQIQFKMQSYYYTGGWTDITNSAWTFSGTDGERGYRWTASNWISLSDFAGGADVPSIAIKYHDDLGNMGNDNIRIAAVYFQYAYFN